MISKSSLEVIQKRAGQIKKPVRVIVFTTDIGCEACPDMVELARAIKAQMGKIVLEIYDKVMDRDKSEQYDITIAPAVVVQGEEGQTVTFFGLIEDVFLEVLLDTLHAVSEKKVWFPENIRCTVRHLTNDVKIRVLVESDCALCKPVAETAIGLALESSYIKTDIITASDYPELIKKYNITTLPKTIFGENLHMDGHVKESEFLEMIFQAEGVKPGPDRRCMVCGKPSPDAICSRCRTKIQAEAVDHKLKTEKL